MKLIKDNLIFILLFLVYLICGAWYLLTHQHGDEILFLNNNHSSALDLVFKYSTKFGEEIFWVIAILCFLLFVNYKTAIVGFSIVILETLLVQIPKRLIFHDIVRPQKYFEGKVILKVVEGVNVHHFHSFPSGHTGSAFALAMFLTIYTKNKYYSILYFVGAVMVAISRMYLIQHFLRDVYVGAILGILASIIVYYIFENYLKIDSNSKINNSLLSKKNSF